MARRIYLQIRVPQGHGFKAQCAWVDKHAPQQVRTDFPHRLSGEALKWWDRESKKIQPPFPKVRFDFVRWIKAPKSNRRRKKEILEQLAQGRIPAGFKVHKKPYRGPEKNWIEGEYVISVPSQKWR